MSEVNLTLGGPIEVKVAPAEGATNVTVQSATQNVVQVQAAIATDGLQGADGAGVPTNPAGSTGQALVKSTDAANDTEWAYIDKLHINVRNTTGNSIPAGSVVYAAGLQGNNVLIDLADASDSSKMPAIGFTYEEISHNSNGDVISAGVLNQNIHNVSGADEGKVLYVSTTAGEVTVTKPSGSANLVQNVGIVLKANNNNIVQKFKVSAIDRTNDIPNLANGTIFLGGGTNQRSPYTFPVATPNVGDILKVTASNQLTFEDSATLGQNLSNANLVASASRTFQVREDGRLSFTDAQTDTILAINESTKRVGVNTAATDEALHVSGNTKVDGDIIVSGTVDGKDVSTLMSNLADDSGPRLGGTLELGGQGIQDSTGIDLLNDVFVPTSSIHIGSTSPADQSLHITNGTIKIDDGVNPYTLPSADGSANQVIKTDGSGALSFTDQAADTNLGNTNLTLEAARVVEMGNGKSVDFQSGGESKFKIFSMGTAFGTSRFTVNGNGTTTSGQLRMKDADNSHILSLTAPASMSDNVTFTLPGSDGQNGNVLKTDGAGNLSFATTAKPTVFDQVYSQSFFDDIGIAQHFLPFKDINEQGQLYQEEAAMLMPFNGRIKSVSLKCSAITAPGNFTVRVHSLPTGSSIFSGSNWTEEESEVLPFAFGDSNHTFHFVFDNAQHFEPGDSISISLQANSTPGGGNAYWHVTTVVEFNTSSDLGASSVEHETNP